MHTKALPAVPEDVQPLEAIEAVRSALPRVPRPTADCCARLAERLPWIEDRGHAGEWLGFLRALGAARNAGSGLAPVRPLPDRPEMARRFREDVLGAREALSALEAGAADVDAAYEAVRPVVPPWERRRSSSWESTWREHVRRLLEWAVALELAERVPVDGAADRFRRRSVA